MCKNRYFRRSCGVERGGTFEGSSKINIIQKSGSCDFSKESKQFVIDEFQEIPLRKYLICDTLLFFHLFFAISFHIRSNTYSKVMILYPKGNSMLLNTFLTLFW